MRWQEALRSLKQPLLQDLERTEGVIVRDLPALPQAIVQASAGLWSRLTHPDGLLAAEPLATLSPNPAFFAH